MKIIVIHSHQTKCGVREYGRQLDESLRALGVELAVHSYADLGVGLERTQAGDVWLVHFESGLVNPAYLNNYTDIARSRGAKVVFCCHWYEHAYMTQHYAGHVDHFVLHREYGDKLSNTSIIPLACPVYTSPEPVEVIRVRLGLPRDKTVLTTIGFLTHWKRLPEVMLGMLNAVAHHPELFIHFHTPWPFNDFDARHEQPRIHEVIDAHPCGDRVLFTTEFLPERATLDIAYASDLGFVFHGHHTHSVSAATKQFVSARRPLAVTGSSHASDIHGGIVRIDTFDPHAFARGVVEVAVDATRLEALGAQMAREYERMNMNTAAAQYLDLIKRIA